MLVRDKKHLVKGLVLSISFLVVLGIMFTPNFGDNMNALEASDRLFNSIAKGSTYFIPDLQKSNQGFMGKTFRVDIKLKTSELGQRTATVFKKAGATVTGEGAQFEVSGDLGKVLGAAISDSGAMFHNRDSELSAKYGLPGLEVMAAWWNGLKEVNKDLVRQKQFKEASFVDTVIKRGVEVGYNFFGIEAGSAVSRAGMLAFALIFYVLYTLWWGIGILFLFEGIGLEMKAGGKKEH
jgi:hypothetical protein